MKKKIRNLSNIPEQFDILSIMAIGEALKEDAFTEQQRLKEQLPRKRKALNKIYFNNKWK